MHLGDGAQAQGILGSPAGALSKDGTAPQNSPQPLTDPGHARRHAQPQSIGIEYRDLPAQILEEFRTLFGHTILERYGMTETLMNMSNPYAGERRAGTVGLPLPGVSARIVDGEVQLRGPNIFADYWRREEATRASFQDGWFRTGDMAQRSADGYYTLLGRKSDLIISGGFNIYPREIEDFLLEQDEVAEAVVIGVPDKLRGEIPVAYIVSRCPFAAEELEARCRATLASFKVPRHFVTVEKLPRTALGKIQKHLLPPWPA